MSDKNDKTGLTINSRHLIFSKLFDHTLLKSTATKDDIFRICDEAKDYNFYSVCLFPCFVKDAVNRLKDSAVGVVTVVGFPLGCNCSSVKVYETKQAIDDGASEIDMVVNLGAYFEHSSRFSEDIEVVARVCGEHSVLLKTIIETSNLDTKQIEEVTKICVESGSDYIKTSTGFSSRGCSKEDILTIQKTLASMKLPRPIGIKASGGVRTLDQVIELVNLGATRIGSSSAVSICKAYMEQKKSQEL